MRCKIENFRRGAVIFVAFELSSAGYSGVSGFLGAFLLDDDYSRYERKVSAEAGAIGGAVLAPCVLSIIYCCGRQDQAKNDGIAMFLGVLVLGTLMGGELVVLFKRPLVLIIWSVTSNFV